MPSIEHGFLLKEAVVPTVDRSLLRFLLEALCCFTSLEKGTCRQRPGAG